MSWFALRLLLISIDSSLLLSMLQIVLNDGQSAYIQKNQFVLSSLSQRKGE
jgi:hypothetical protein